MRMSGLMAAALAATMDMQQHIRKMNHYGSGVANPLKNMNYRVQRGIKFDKNGNRMEINTFHSLRSKSCYMPHQGDNVRYSLNSSGNIVRTKIKKAA